jgi:3-methyladenine DNA glycosylase/8-oxoguanine DNA glycosylase
MDAGDLYARLQRHDQSAFETLASALVSQDNNSRKQAEEFYQQLVSQQPDVAVRFLASGLSSQPDMRHFCCVYLRKVRRAPTQSCGALRA